MPKRALGTNRGPGKNTSLWPSPSRAEVAVGKGSIVASRVTILGARDISTALVTPLAAPWSRELADSHVHLDHYAPEVVSRMLTRARRAGVHHFLTVGGDLASSARAVGLAARRRGVLAAVGVHPTRVGGLDLPRAMAELRRLARQPGVAAIGEVGLDDSRPESPGEQEAFFSACLELAAELDLALALHLVGAHERGRTLLRSAPAGRRVVHYFQGDWSLAESYLELGCCISVGKPVTRSERQVLREAVRQIPLDRLLLETDTYPLPGRTTEPRDVVLICQAVAELKGIALEAVAEATTANYLRLFCIRAVGG